MKGWPPPMAMRPRRGGSVSISIWWTGELVRQPRHPVRHLSVSRNAGAARTGGAGRHRANVADGAGAALHAAGRHGCRSRRCAAYSDPRAFPVGVAAAGAGRHLSFGQPHLCITDRLCADDGDAQRLCDPARDSALTRVAETGIQQAVTMAMGVQMGSQLVGMLIAALAALTGTPALLIFQAIIMLTGCSRR